MLKKKKDITQILTLPVAQQWHLSDRRTPRVHEILHVRYEFLFLRAGLPLASPYYRRRWSTNARYHNVRTRWGTFRRGCNGSFTFITRFTGRCAALFTFPPRPSFQFWCWKIFHFAFNLVMKIKRKYKKKNKHIYIFRFLYWRETNVQYMFNMNIIIIKRYFHWYRIKKSHYLFFYSVNNNHSD